MSYLNVYTEAVVISMFKGGDILDKTNQLTGKVNNHSVVTIKVKEGTRSRYAKYVNFGRPRKDKSVIANTVDHHYVF